MSAAEQIIRFTENNKKYAIAIGSRRFERISKIKALDNVATKV
ncbi:MAG: hypothetical protein ACRD93_00250 [Nitrososphaeraceae archaeon]